jgi:phosphatidylserine decarboxylase
MRIFCENKREYTILKNNRYGDVVICDVGATLTGSIIQTYKANEPLNKGDEKGHFAFGGSTLILLFEPNKMTFSKDLIENTKKGFESTVLMGETIGI